MTGSRTPRPAPPASARNLATRPPRTSYRYRWSSGSNKRAAHDAGVKAKPLRGGPRPAWTPTPHPRLPKTKPEDQKQPQPGTTSRLDRLRSFMDDPEGDGVHTAIEESSAAACRLSAVSPLSSPVSQLRPGELP